MNKEVLSGLKVEKGSANTIGNRGARCWERDLQKQPRRNVIIYMECNTYLEVQRPAQNGNMKL